SVTESGSLSVSSLRITITGSAALNGNNAVGTLAVVAPGGLSFTDTISLTVGTVDTVAGITTTNSPITLSADSLTLTQVVTAGSGRVTIQPRTPGQSIDLGTKTGLGLTNAELQQVTAGVLQVGHVSSGNVNVSAAITAHARFNTLPLH